MKQTSFEEFQNKSFGKISTPQRDAFDTLYIGSEEFPQHDLYPISVGGVK